MELSKLQMGELIHKYARKEGGLSSLLELYLEVLMKAEREDFLRNSAEWNKGNGYRKVVNYSNGYCLELRVPRDRLGTFNPVILALLRDQQEESYRLIQSLYSKGLTGQDVSKVFAELYGKHYSTSSISRMQASAKKQVDTWLKRPLGPYYKAFYIDATFVKTQRAGRVKSEAFYTVMGVTKEQTREVLAIVNMPSESSVGWAKVLDNLRARGVQDVGLIVADGLSNLGIAVASIFPNANLQRCVVHLKRNLKSEVRKVHQTELMDDLAFVFQTNKQGDSSQQGWERWLKVINKWQKHYSKAFQKYHDDGYRAYFTYLDYHVNVRSMIYTTNWIERLNRAFKKVLRVRGAMPNGESVIYLMARVALDQTYLDRRIPKLKYLDYPYSQNPSPFHGEGRDFGKKEN